MVSDLTLAAWTADTVWPTTAPAAFIRKAVTTYPLMTKPPLDNAGVQRAMASIVPRFFPDEAVPITGAPGTVAGVTAADSTEKTPVPTALVAWTWNLTAVPLTRPVTARLVASAAACRRTPT